MSVTNLEGATLFAATDRDLGLRRSIHPEYVFQTDGTDVLGTSLETGETSALASGDTVDIASDCSVLVSGTGTVSTFSRDLTPQWVLFGAYAALLDHPDGAVVMVVSDSGEISVVDMASADVLWTTFDPGDSVGVVGDLAVLDDTEVRDARTGEALWTILPEDGIIPVGRLVADVANGVQVYSLVDGSPVVAFEDDDLFSATTPEYVTDVVAHIDGSGNLQVDAFDPQYSWTRPFEQGASSLSSFAAADEIVVAKGNESSLIAAYTSIGDALWSRSDLEVRRLGGATDSALAVLGPDLSTLVDISTGATLATFEGDNLRIVGASRPDRLILADWDRDVLVAVDAVSGDELWTADLLDDASNEDD